MAEQGRRKQGAVGVVRREDGTGYWCSHVHPTHAKALACAERQAKKERKALDNEMEVFVDVWSVGR